MESKKRFIVFSFALMLLCGIVHRFNADIGYIATVLALVYYIFADVKRTVYYLRKFKEMEGLKKVKALTSVAMVLVLITGVATGKILYFLVLALMGADYLIFDKLDKQNG